MNCKFAKLRRRQIPNYGVLLVKHIGDTHEAKHLGLSGNHVR